MGFLTALLYGAGGVGSGLQQRTQNQQNQQQLDQEQQYRQSEENRQDQQLAIQQAAEARAAEAATRNKGIDPSTGKPFLLPVGISQVAPNNKGKAATDPQTLTHLYALANWYTQSGQSDLAAETLDRAKAMESDIRSSNALTLRQNLDTYNQGMQSQRTADEIAAGITRTGMNNNTSLATNANTVNQSNVNNVRTTGQSDVNNIRTTQTSAANNAAHIAQESATQTDLFMRGYEAQNNKDRTAATKSGNTSPTLTYPALDGFKKGLAARISAVAKDPKKAPQIIRELETQGAGYGYDPEWIKYAVQQVQDAARAASTPQFAPIAAPPVGGFVPTAPPNPVP